MLRNLGSPCLRPCGVLIALGLTFAGSVRSQDIAADSKLFQNGTDIGKVKIPGSAVFDPVKKEFRLTASGANVWAKEDAFFFDWRNVSGDLVLTADPWFIGVGKDPHRKAGWMVRQGLDADAPYAGVSIHGDGLITLHYRKEKGGVTFDVRSTAKAPAKVRLERHGDIFALRSR